jgi:SAM-dependent methyltransferase
MSPAFNPRDRDLWNGLFANVPPDWRTAPPSSAMVGCREFLLRSGATSVLDLGCGVGRWAVYLARAGLEVSGSDFAENGLRYAEEWARAEDLRLRLRCCPITELPFPGERFDAVVAALVLDNVTREEMLAGIECIRASLADDGVVFASFNPVVTCADSGAIAEDNPTRGVTQTRYEDDELQVAFEGFTVLDFRRFELGTRGLFLRRGTLT